MSDAHVDVLVIGGGPAGSVAAAMAAKAGRRVRLLEAGQHPRTHVGESLLPGITPILDEIGALPQIERAGFAIKTGSTHRHWGTTPRWDLWFADSDTFETAWFVRRDRFDAILYDNAVRLGVETHSRAAVTGLQWHDDRIAAVQWRDAQGTPRQTSATHIIDASGAAAIVARDRGWHAPIAGMAHYALWAHYADASRLPAPRAAQAFFVAEATRWFWLFPLSGGGASVGVVELEETTASAATRRFETAVAGNDEVRAVLGPRARRVSPVRRARDFSYRVRPVAMPGVRLVGDAAGFIDPVLSTGVFLAMHSAWDAARSLDGPAADEAQRAADYDARHAELFDDLLRLVCFFYERGRPVTDYFWESKKIVADAVGPLSPRRAFLMLTSGLIGNLALPRPEPASRLGRAQAQDVGPLGATDAPTSFLCVHLSVPFSPKPGQSVHALPIPEGEAGSLPTPDRASVYLVVEPDDPEHPCVARTASLSIDVLAPRLGRDAARDPALADLVRTFIDMLAAADRAPQPLPALWRTHAPTIAAWCAALPPTVRHVRTFGL